MKDKIAIIINPNSGSLRKKTLLRLLELHLDKKNYNYEIHYTSYRGHAREISQQAVKESLYAVIAAGGDGTINEVASALVHSQTALGIVPVGSGNGLAYHLGIKRDVKKAIQCIHSHKRIKIDSATANGRFFINVAGLGVDAAVAFRIMNHPKKGFLPYFLASIKEIINFKYFNASVTIDEKPCFEDEFALITVANGSFYGYDFTIAPQARLTDGLLDIILVKKVPVIKYLLLAIRMINKTIDKSPDVIILRGKKVVVTPDRQTYFHTDGEGFESSGKIRIEVIPSSIYLLTQNQ